MAYDQKPPVYPQQYTAYPEFYKRYAAKKEDYFKGCLKSYLKTNEPELIYVGVTPDGRLVTAPDPVNTPAKIQQRRADKEAEKKSKKGGKKK